MKGSLKSITLESSQEAWQLDLPDIIAPAPQHRVKISAAQVSSRSANQPQKKKKRGPTTLEPVNENDDDDFMPDTEQQAPACASSSRSRTNICSKLPSVRCAPSFFIKFIEHLDMRQRMTINDLGFGGLLQFYADGLDTSDIVVYLLDKLNPDSLILEVGTEGGLRITELCVKKVLGIPDGDMDPPSSTEEENALALIQFKKYVYVEPNKEVKCNHLLGILKKLKIDDALAVRIFFVVAFNKLLFPAVDHNIRGQDAFLTKDLSNFRNINWCKAVLHELRHAAITWRSEKKKSIAGCAIFLILFYLDNLESCISIDPYAIPRAKYLHKSVIEKLILEDRRSDGSGNVTFGNLQLKNIADTCYRFTEPDPSRVSAAANSSSISIAGSSSRKKATDCLQQFATKASQAMDLVQSDSNMLVDAHKEFIRTMRSVLQTDPVENRAKDEYGRTQ